MDKYDSIYILSHLGLKTYCVFLLTFLGTSILFHEEEVVAPSLVADAL